MLLPTTAETQARRYHDPPLVALFHQQQGLPQTGDHDLIDPQPSWPAIIIGGVEDDAGGQPAFILDRDLVLRCDVFARAARSTSTGARWAG